VLHGMTKPGGCHVLCSNVTSNVDACWVVVLQAPCSSQVDDFV